MSEDEKPKSGSDKYIPPPMDPYATYQTPYERRPSNEQQNPFIEFRRFADKQFSSMFENFPSVPKMFGMDDEMKNIRSHFEKEMEAMREHRRQIMEEYHKQQSGFEAIRSELARPSLTAQTASPPAEQNLPTNWEKATTSDGKTYYIDWNTGKASKDPPNSEATAPQSANQALLDYQRQLAQHEGQNKERTMMARQGQHENGAGNGQTSEENLPAGWEKKEAKNGRSYFINHNDRSTTWDDPRLNNAKCPDHLSSTPLPGGWEVKTGKNGRTYFVNNNDRSTTWNDPRDAQTSSFHPTPDTNIHAEGKPLTWAEKRAIWRRGLRNCPELKTASDIQETNDDTELAMYEALGPNQTSEQGATSRCPWKEKKAKPWLFPALGYDGMKRLEMQRQGLASMMGDTSDEIATSTEHMDPITEDEHLVPWLAFSPYSPFRLLGKSNNDNLSFQERHLRDALRTHKPWLHAFEDLMALERTGQMLDRHETTNRTSPFSWLTEMFSKDTPLTLDMGRAAPSLRPTLKSLLDSEETTKEGNDGAHSFEDAEVEELHSLFDTFIWPDADSVLSSIKAAHEDFDAMRQTDEEDDAFQSKHQHNDNAVNVQRSSSTTSSSSWSNIEEREKKPSIVSTMTKTTSRTLPDGSIETKRVLKNRFSDGREESEESTDISQPPNLRRLQTELSKKEDVMPSSENGKPATQQKKNGWFWY
ncbi:hypothetical protein H2198_006177 [Neophaeococcomyces mojaviensis]|uniref:Uncharacterized protein n=1 Tax=Neophaeococcomyces mojaviensis TaxID=3383035 RepID=A0ACC3A3L1_9EURO|nr:hypothetical protein H2198_006177 [Knufia sp. JES_112]